MAESGIKALIGKRMTKLVKFLGADVIITKLSVAQVMEIQSKAKNLDTDPEGGFELLKSVIKMSVDGADDISDDDFKSFPMEELSKLSTEIMKYSGIAGEQGK